MNKYLNEAWKRFMQIILSIFIFDLFPLIKIRHYFYRLNFNIDKNCCISSNVMFLKPHFNNINNKITLKIGQGIRINRNTEIDYSGGLVIGDDVWISQNVLIETHEHKIDKNKSKDLWEIQHSQLLIEDNVWIGANVIILSKCTKIGKNAIIGAGSIVSKNVEENVIVAGNPAKVIKNI